MQGISIGKVKGAYMAEQSPIMSNEEQANADQLREEIVRLQEELHKTKKKTFGRMLRTTIGILVTVAAVAVLISVLAFPVLRVYGTAMTPNLSNGDIVISVKSSPVETGDIIAFYYNNKILIKRVIAQAGDWVDISEDGTVYVNNVALDEPYVSNQALGSCNIELPYQVPDSRVFVMGDDRSVSLDSRSTEVGCAAEEQVVGKIIFCVWPIDHFGPVR